MLNGTTAASTTTDTNGNYAFRDLRKGGSYDLTPAGGLMRFNPPGYSFKLMRDETAHFSGVVERERERELEVVCTDADKDREGRAIIDRFGAGWRRRIESAPPKVRADGVHGQQRPSLGRIEYQSSFFRSCTAAVVTARYVWEVINLHGKERVPGEKRFTCGKLGGIWLCN